MIKVPGTAEGVGAIEALTAEGINVNVTLLFSLDHYEAVTGAYLRGLQRAAEPSQVASVASFFVSRVDTAVDRLLEKIGNATALALRGTAGIANAKRAYRRYQQIFEGDAFAPLRERGARPQRVLWASTGTKNPAYSDVLYVEGLVGSDTVNTVPPATLDAFLDHGEVGGAPLTQDVAAADEAVVRLAELGVDLDAVTDRLQVEGVSAFVTSFDQLLDALAEKGRKIRTRQAHAQVLSLGEHQAAVEGRLVDWQDAALSRRLWAKDHTVWFPEPQPELTDRLGWLTLPEVMHDQLDELRDFAAEIAAEGTRHVVLLGMGGSSLAPEVYQRTFGARPGFPELIVLDSTHPAAVRAVEEAVDPAGTLFLVSSKSGTTIEPLSFFRYFWQRVSEVAEAPGRRFAAVTDPGTPLVELAGERGFRRVFEAPPDVGGRYSALTVFGLVPAALIGADVHQLLDRSWTMAEASAFCVPETHNPALALGAALGELAGAGRDKATFLVSPTLAAFPSWVEQLIAESTGKDGAGILPVADEPAGSPEEYGQDRFFVYLAVAGDDDAAQVQRLAALQAAGHPVARIRLQAPEDLGGEMFRAEMATAAAGAVLGIHPFNQPDVQLAKDLAGRAMRGELEGGEVEEVAAADPNALRQAAERWLAGARRGDYVALQAYLAPAVETTAALQEMRLGLRRRLRLATTLGYGPRFLHSTGQLHKGGPNSGLFLQLVDDAAPDLAVPETDYSFGELIAAQAVGDYQALSTRQRRVLRVHLGSDTASGLKQLREVLHG